MTPYSPSVSVRAMSCMFKDILQFTNISSRASRSLVAVFLPFYFVPGGTYFLRAGATRQNSLSETYPKDSHMAGHNRLCPTGSTHRCSMYVSCLSHFAYPKIRPFVVVNLISLLVDGPCLGGKILIQTLEHNIWPASRRADN